MSNDPSHGTPPPSDDGDSPKTSDGSLTPAENSGASDSPDSDSQKKTDAAVSVGEGAEPNSSDSDKSQEDAASDTASSDPDSAVGQEGAAIPRSESSDPEKTPEGDGDSSGSGPASDGLASASKTDESDGHDKDHEWHDEHDDYSPEYDDPYHDEYDHGEGHEGEDAHYYQDDDYHHHDEDHGSGHSIGGGVSGSGKTTARPAAKTNVSSEDDDDWDDDDEEGGGPVKNFLEHLEDLRWVIIKCVVAVLVCMCLCLVGANQAVDILTDPLNQANEKIRDNMIEKARADRIAARAEGLVDLALQFQMGANHMNVEASEATFQAFGGDPESTNNILALRLVPQIIGSNVVMGFERIDAKHVIEREPEIDLPKLVPKSPLTPFMLALKTAFFGGFGLASPLVFFFIGQFVLPALHRNEKKYLGYGVFVGTGLFLLGASFAYLVITKLMLGASVMFADWLGFQSTIWIIDEYIAVVLKLLLGVGLGFELPVVLLTLVRIGILDYQKLNAMRAYAVVVILVLCAVLTPPDVISQVLMAMPLYLLYEVSVVIAYIWFRQDQREEEAESGKSGG